MTLTVSLMLNPGEKYLFYLIMISANTTILLDMVCKLSKPNVALCHQMPFTTDQKGFAQSLEKVSEIRLQCQTVNKGDLRE